MRLFNDPVFARCPSRRPSRPAWETPRRKGGKRRPWPDPKVRNGNGGKGGGNKSGMDCGIPADQTGAEHSPAKISRTPETGRERKQLSGQNTGTRKVPAETGKRHAALKRPAASGPAPSHGQGSLLRPGFRTRRKRRKRGGSGPAGTSPRNRARGGAMDPRTAVSRPSRRLKCPQHGRKEEKG